MPQLHLPEKHTQDDLALAGALASMLRSRELYVAWSLDSGPAEPVVPACVVDSPRARRARRTLLGRLFRRKPIS